MNKCLSALTAIIILIFFFNINSSFAIETTETVVQFFEASKNGDVDTMKRLIAGPFYYKRKALLEMNKGYPEFLKKFYDGVSVEILQTEVANDDMVKRNHRDLYDKHYSARDIFLNNMPSGNNDASVVIVKLNFPDGSNFNSKLLLRKTSDGIWRIFDEILNTE
jgi:hypothetical protein